MAEVANTHDQHEVYELPKRVIYESCCGCGASDNVMTYEAISHFRYCPRCAAQYEAGLGALKALAEYISEFIPAWEAHWYARGVEPGWLEEVISDLNKTFLPFSAIKRDKV